MSDARPAPIPLGPAIGTWLVCWFGGGAVLGGALLQIMGHGSGDTLTTTQVAAAAVVGWAAFLGGMWWLSRAHGGGDPIADYAVRFRPVDLLGIPVGLLGQLVIVPLLYVPLRGIWPDTFSQARLEDRAQELADQAGGARTLLLVLVVVIGAPIVEELVYRGLLQRSASAAVGRWAGWIAVSALFALVHLSPVEYPGLFVAGLMFGGAVLLTGRTGSSILVHAAFNAAGLALVLT